MTTYIVTFEINDLARRKRVKERLRTFRYYCPIHKNAWAIRTEKKASELRNFIVPILVASDRLFIIRTGTEAAWRNGYGLGHSEWLKKYL